MAHNVFIGINYADTYEAVVVSDPNDAEYRFETGDPPTDFRAAVEKAKELTEQFGCRCMTLSSLDGFVFDVPGWRYDADDFLIRDERDYHPDGTVKTKAEVEADLVELGAP